MPDNKPPAFMFYAGDFLSSIDVAFMDMELRGVYITLLAYSWLENGIPNEDRKLKVILQCSDEDTYSRYKSEVIDACFKLEKDTWRQPRQERERAKQQERKDAHIKAGKMSQDLRRARENERGKGALLRVSKGSNALELEREVEFETEFWKAYPRKTGKKKTKALYNKIRKSTSKEDVINGLKNHIKGCWSGKEIEFIPYPMTWLNGECWNDDASNISGEVTKVIKRTFVKVCPVCGATKDGCDKNSVDVCRRHKPSFDMFSENKVLMDDDLLMINGIRLDLGLELVGEK